MDKITFVIPTLNEVKTIPFLIKGLKELFNKIQMAYEIICVDGGSSDGTVEICNNLGVKVLFQKKQGYAEALLIGIFNSSGDWIVTMDADFSHPAEFILEFLKYKEDADIIIASRYIKGGFSCTGFLRKCVSRFICILFRYGLSLPVKDITSGFRLYKREVIKALEAQSFISTEFEILVEIFIEAYRKGYSFKEIPFGYTPRRQGKSHILNKIFRLFRGYLSLFWKFLKIRNSLKFADYDERAYYSLNPLQRYWQKKRYRIITDFIKKNGLTVDLGCGSSKIIQSLPEAVAVDISLDKLRYIRKTNRFIINASLDNLPFKDKIFTCIICSEVIEHIKGDNVFKEICRIIKPQGILIIGTPDYNSLIWKIIEFFYNFLGQGYKDTHITRYTNITLKEILKNYEFEIITQKYIFGSELIIKAKKI
ncbi:MAG: bifunctional glycosyltransferase/class I SAM-dependent methyltransferase [Candidatus Omnitrophica bacterium]|nr:bifunctional glycosyltransferase/class I SAM-dependent methyltransferase [Candidatus Omnitrophota bacterium]MCM8800217.1 bifunctional glycosyltransferase/class I SAM-dependent methyltransferase [Candidatus Omnitrophota bacterium]